MNEMNVYIGLALLFICDYTEEVLQSGMVVVYIMFLFVSCMLCNGCLPWRTQSSGHLLTFWKKIPLKMT